MAQFLRNETATMFFLKKPFLVGLGKLRHEKSESYEPLRGQFLSSELQNGHSENLKGLF